MENIRNFDKKGTTLLKNQEKIIELKNVSQQYSGGVLAVDNLNLYVRKGEFITFLGPLVVVKLLRLE